MFETLAGVFGAAAGTCTGVLFLFAAVAKLRHRIELPAMIANYRLLPRWSIAPAAMVLPWAEGAIGLLLILGGVTARIAAVPALILLIAFAWAVAVNIRRGRSHIDCGCGIGGLNQPLRIELVRSNLVLAAALLPLALLPARLTPVEQAIAAVAGLVAFLLILLLNALLAMPSTHTVTDRELRR